MNAEEINIHELWEGYEPNGLAKTAWVIADEEPEPSQETVFVFIGAGVLVVCVVSVVLFASWIGGFFR